MALAGIPRRIALFIYICMSPGWLPIDGAYTETYWQNPFQVYDYYAYRNVRVLSFDVPQQTKTSTWLFTGIREDKCGLRKIYVFIQHGSLPVINPLNETFPPDFALSRSYLHEVVMFTNNKSISFTLTAPLPGTWIAVAFLAREGESDKIKQKGLTGKHCHYLMGSTHIVEAVDDIEELKLEKQYAISIEYRTSQLFRFHLSDVTWEYSVVVNNCSYQVRENGTLHVQKDLCPLVMRARGLGLANHDVPSPWINCSAVEDSSQCTLLYSQPETYAWHYLLVEIDEQFRGSVHLKLSVEAKECISIRSEPPEDVVTPDPVTPAINGTQVPVINGKSGTTTSVPLGPSVATIVSPSLVQYSAIQAQANRVSSSARLHVEFPHKSKTVSSAVSPMSSSSRSTCVWVPELGRFSESYRPYNIQYTLRIGTIPLANLISVQYEFPMVLKLYVKSDLDTGGTLKFKIYMPLFILNTTVHNVKVEACIMKGRIPVVQSGVSCPADNLLQVNSSNNDSQRDQVYFPYPEPGNWYIALLASCYEISDSNFTKPVPCGQTDIPLSFALSLTGCVDNNCGEHGTCKEYFSGVYHFSSCECVAKWRGYGCTDGSGSESATMQLTAALLLTLSNFMFVPAIILAICRQYYIEALVYFYTMFFSSFYHACDGDRKYIYCLMPMSVLSFCDFFGSILSFWVTLVAMSRLSQHQRSFMYVLAALGLAVGVAWDKHSAWTFVVPCGIALTVTLISWCIQCHSRNQCYPSRRRWLLFLLPGVLFAGAGLAIFAFFETEDNYCFTHSTWHAFCAVSIVFLLPPRRQPKSGTEPLPMPFRAFDQPAELSELHDDSSDDPMLDLEGSTLVPASFHRSDNPGVSYVV